MSVTAKSINSGIPVADGMYIVGDASGTALIVSPGDWVIWSANYLIASEDADAYYKVSGAGVAVDRNPKFDEYGNQIINTALLVSRYGVFRVSASFSGKPLYGVNAYPVTTGSGVNAPTGVTGVASTWNTAAPVLVSGGTGAAPAAGVAQVIGWYDSGPAGTGQLDIVVWDRNADYY
jgi:hypothetical protein